MCHCSFLPLVFPVLGIRIRMYAIVHLLIVTYYILFKFSSRRMLVAGEIPATCGQSGQLCHVTLTQMKEALFRCAPDEPWTGSRSLGCLYDKSRFNASLHFML